MLRLAFTVSSFTLISRLFGYMRDILIASILGAGPIAEAYITAFRLPNLFRTLFAEGAFSAAFVPLFSKVRAENTPEKSHDFLNHTFSLLVLILIGFVSLMQIFMPWIMQWLAPGFVEHGEKFSTAILFSRITMPYLFFISLVSMLSGILQTMGRFAAAAAAPIYLNLCMIGGITLLARYTPTAGHALVISISIAGVIQFATLAYACRRLGWMPKWVRPTITPEVRLLFKKIIPGIVGSSSTQINLLVNTMIASTVPGGIAFLYYADRLVQLPLSLTGTALGTVMLPLLSKKIQAGALQEATTTHNRAMELALLLVLPAAVALNVIALPIVTILFERDAFTTATSLHTAHAMMALAFGLPAFVLLKLVITPFFAHQDTKTPVMVAIGCILLNIALNLSFVEQYQHVGIALSTSITAWINVLFLMGVLWKRQWWQADALLKTRLIKISAASLLMGVILHCTEHLPAAASGFLQAVLMLGVLIITGAASYFTCLILLRTIPKQELKALLKKS